MHEFGLCESFMDAVIRRAADREVNAVRLRIGVLHRVDEESFRQAFGFVSQGTVAQGASVDIVVIPAVLACRECGVNTQTAELLPACPACDATDLEVVAGNELVLESIRLAAAEAVEEVVPPELDDGHTHDEQTHERV